MKSKYFTVEVKPYIRASFQAASSAAFAAKDVLFDWTSFQIPRGAAKLLSVNIALRGADGASAANLRDIDLYFAKSIDGTAPTTVGNPNSTMNAGLVITNHIIGYTKIDNSEYGNDAIDLFNVAQTGSGAAASLIPNLVLEGEPDSGDHIGLDTIYVCATISGSYSFGTTVITRGASSATATSVPTDKGSDDDPDAENVFAKGDIIHSATDDVLGTLTNIGNFDVNNQALSFSAGITNTVADNEELFNVYPIKLVFSFEK